MLSQCSHCYNQKAGNWRTIQILTLHTCWGGHVDNCMLMVVLVVMKIIIRQEVPILRFRIIHNRKHNHYIVYMPIKMSHIWTIQTTNDLFIDLLFLYGDGHFGTIQTKFNKQWIIYLKIFYSSFTQHIYTALYIFHQIIFILHIAYTVQATIKYRLYSIITLR